MKTYIIVDAAILFKLVTTIMIIVMYCLVIQRYIYTSPCKLVGKDVICINVIAYEDIVFLHDVGII